MMPDCSDVRSQHICHKLQTDSYDKSKEYGELETCFVIQVSVSVKKGSIRRDVPLRLDRSQRGQSLS